MRILKTFHLTNILFWRRLLLAALAATGLTLLCPAANHHSWAMSRPAGSEGRPDMEALRAPMAERLREAGFRAGDPVFMRIFKEERLLELWMQPAGSPEAPFRLFAVYPICAMSGTLGPKLKQGDRQAPEGFYAVGLKQFNPHSRFHLSFNIGYPNSYDRSHGCTGDFIMVHGNCVSEGCFAMTDRFIEEIYGLAQDALRGGQPFFRIHIFPFRLNAENLRRHAASNWLSFWEMLRPGYDYFERHKLPPDIVVRNKAYALSELNK